MVVQSENIVEFLGSGILSNGVFLLQNEDKNSTAASCIGNASSDLLQQIEAENAVRLALFLTRSFGHYCKLWGEGEVSSVGLDSFSVLYSASSDDDEQSESNGDDILQKVTLLEVYARVEDQYLGRKIACDNLSLASSDRDQGGHAHEHELQDLHNSEAASLQMLGSYLYFVFSGGKQLPPDLLLTSSRDSHGVTRAAEDYNYSMGTVGNQLGPDLYSEGKRLRLDRVASSAPVTRAPAPAEHSNDDFDIINEYQSKISRTPDKTIFSRLVDSKMFPVSICRLLSDMLNIGPRSGTESPLNSLESVAQDLEQMISNPNALLHDDPHFPKANPKSPLFGQRYFGTQDEVLKVLHIAAGMEQSLNHTNSDESVQGTQAVFVSGVAGSGKSRLVQAVGDHLSISGWIVVRAKFERDKEHASRRVLSRLFNELVVLLIKKKEECNSSDVAYSERASSLILDTIGREGLSSIVDFLPSIPLLFPDIGIDRGGHETIADDALVFALILILVAILEKNRLVMFHCDDLQWCDKTSLSLIRKFLNCVGGNKDIKKKVLFVGSYRHNAIQENHPFNGQYYLLKESSGVRTTEIKLSGLSAEAVVDMLMTELRLPQRMVVGLAQLVHKKTSAHAYFVVQLLNSLLRDSTIRYSPMNRRYIWDEDSIAVMPISNTVAGLISANLLYLPTSNLQILRLLSCFGTRTDCALLQVLEGFQSGIVSAIDPFVEQGILDKAGGVVIFAHDLIQQEVYDGIPKDERNALHLELGQFLGGLDQITVEISKLQLDGAAFFTGRRSMTSSLVSLACDEVNSLGPNLVEDQDQRRQFAQWNHIAGQEYALQSNFGDAIHYLLHGIAFLGDDSWQTNTQLCVEVYKTAAAVSYALGQSDSVFIYSTKVIANSTFEDSLEVQLIVLKSMGQIGRHAEVISKGIEILMRLDFDVTDIPSKERLARTMISTQSMISKYDLDGIMDLCGKAVDKLSQVIMELLDTIVLSCYALGSQMLPMIACAIIQFSLEQGICRESAIAWASFGTFKIVIGGDYAAAKQMATVARAITTKHQTMNISKLLHVQNRADLFLCNTVDIWSTPPRVIATKLLKYHQDAMKNGPIDIHDAMFSLRQSCRFKLLGGGNLSLTLISTQDSLKLMAKHSSLNVKYAVLDSILLEELMGKSLDHLSLFDNCSINNINDLLLDAKSSKDNILLYTTYLYKMMVAFWRGDCDAAEKSSYEVLKVQPTASMPTIHLIYHTFFRGIVSFQQYRKSEGIERDRKLEEGKKVMNEMEKWTLNCSDVFENKWLLLRAEHFASINEDDLAEKSYTKSINASRDHGNIHELGLGYELFGNFHSSRGSWKNATHCYAQAHAFYNQWGANAVADRIVRDNPGLDLTSAIHEELKNINSSKRENEIT